MKTRLIIWAIVGLLGYYNTMMAYDNSWKDDNKYTWSLHTWDTVVDGIAYELFPDSMVARVAPFNVLYKSRNIIYDIDIFYNYYLNETEAPPTYENRFYEGVVKIPEHITVDGKIYTVTDIDIHAFDNCFDITEIDVPPTISNNRLFASHLDLGGNFYSDGTLVAGGILISSAYSQGDWVETFEVVSIGGGYFYRTYHNAFPWLFSHEPGTIFMYGDRVAAINPYSFESGEANVTKFDTLEIPDGATSIMDGAAASEYLYINNLVLPKSLEKIGQAAFQNSKVDSINFDYIKEIGDSAFVGCKLKNMYNLELPCVKRIGSSAFRSITKKNLTINGAVIDKCAFEVSRIDTITLTNCHLNTYSFAYTSWYKYPHVTIGDNCTLDEYSFAAQLNPYRFSSLKIGNNVTLNDYSLIDCHLTDNNAIITMGENDTIYAAFDGWDIKEFALGRNAVVSLRTFTGIKNLMRITVPDNDKLNASVNGILYSNDVKRLIYIPKYHSWARFDIDERVETIGSYAVNYAENVTKISIPKNVRKIEPYAISGTKITDVYCYVSDPNEVEADRTSFFYDTSVAYDQQIGATLYVPKNTAYLYSKLEPWNYFNRIVEMEGESGDFIRGDLDCSGVVNGADVTSLYNLLLNGDPVKGNADVNGDSVINGADVTALYDLLLK